MLDRRIMGELGPSFSTRRLDYLLLFLIRASIFLTLVALRLPLLLTSLVRSCTLLGIEYISVVICKTTNKTKVSRPNCSKAE